MSVAKRMAFKEPTRSAQAMVELSLSGLFFADGKLRVKIGKSSASWLSRTGAVTAKIARRSMRKAPAAKTKSGKAKNLTRFGGYQKIKSGKRKGQERFKKGLHSPPGVPPYYRSGGVNLRDIVYTKKQELAHTKTLNVYTMTNRAGGKRINKPPAILQESGGGAKIAGNPKTALFPARPYMAPAGVKGAEYMKKVVREGIK